MIEGILRTNGKMLANTLVCAWWRKESNYLWKNANANANVDSCTVFFSQFHWLKSLYKLNGIKRGQSGKMTVICKYCVIINHLALDVCVRALRVKEAFSWCKLKSFVYSFDTNEVCACVFLSLNSFLPFGLHTIVSILFTSMPYASCLDFSHLRFCFIILSS